MIAADQNSRVHEGVTLDAVEHPSCAGCHFFNAPDGDCKGGHPTLCTNTGRADGRSIIWVARTKAENPATVAADILRAQGKDLDEASVERAEAVCEELVAPADGAEVRRLATAACKSAMQEMEDYLRNDMSRISTVRREREREKLLAGNRAAADKLDAFSIIFDDPAYASLGLVLTRAYAQAATGKGAERHGQGQPFERQPMQDLIRLHGVGFATGQASKKAQEALRLPRARAVAELLGAINYLAGAVIAIEAGDTHHND